MAYTNTEVVDAAMEKLDFLASEYSFNVMVKDARGTYLSQIVFESNFLKIFIGVWGPGNEFWFTFTPLTIVDAPSLEVDELLNGITRNRNYFEHHIHSKTEWPVFTHTFPQYFERCAVELKQHCRKIFLGDVSQWDDLVEQVLTQRIEQILINRQRWGKVELDNTDKKGLEPLIGFIRKSNPDFSLQELEIQVLDRLTNGQ